MQATTARTSSGPSGPVSPRIALTVPSSALTERPLSSEIDFGSAKNDR
jgi:hypothetical protein